ncbi:MAG: hypothetical protein WBA42_09190, partial [Mesorhizobium sp.]
IWLESTSSDRGSQSTFGLFVNGSMAIVDPHYDLMKSSVRAAAGEYRHYANHPHGWRLYLR